MNWKAKLKQRMLAAVKPVVDAQAVMGDLARGVMFEHLLSRAARRHGGKHLLTPNEQAFSIVEGTVLRIFVVGDEDEPFHLPLASDRTATLVKALQSGLLTGVEVRRAGESVGAGWALGPMRRMPIQAVDWLLSRTPAGTSTVDLAQLDYGAVIHQMTAKPDYVPLFARGVRDNRPPTPDRSDDLPEPYRTPQGHLVRLPARPRSKSAVFVNNSYYHFNVLSDGLRRRGWDVSTVSLERPDSPQQQFFHGQDISLYHPDPAEMRKRTREFFWTIPERYAALHFYGQFQSSLFPENFSASLSAEALPWDFVELRRHGTILGYMPSGCLDGGLQTSIRDLSGGACRHCVWELRSDVCSDARNGAWNAQVFTLCDWVGLEGDFGTLERQSRKTVYGPVVATLSPEDWSPTLDVPSERVIERDDNEILVYHGVGNYAARRAQGRDIKGTGAAIAAVERLQSEGHRVRLLFVHDVPSREVKFIQRQADIVLDQLNYGRYGATAREGMMLGKPVICRLSARQAEPLEPLRAVIEAPMVNADETTVYEALRELVLDPGMRSELGQRARAFALAWHGRDACAARYEAVIDRLRQGLTPDDPGLFPSAPLTRERPGLQTPQEDRVS